MKVQTGFSVVSIITFIIFCAVLRWESFISRYMISYLALLCITVCVQIQSVEEHNRYRNLSYAIVGIIYFCSFVEIWGLVGFNKSMCERGGALVKEESYFLNRTGEYKDYAFAVDYIRKNDYKKVGFLCGEDHYEYPLIKMLEDHIEKYEHVGVNNETLKYEDGSYIPDCIFVIGQDIQDSYVYHGVEYQIAYDYGEGWKYILTHE